jgi:hypothetical protein
MEKWPPPSADHVNVSENPEIIGGVEIPKDVQNNMYWKLLSEEQKNDVLELLKKGEEDAIKSLSKVLERDAQTEDELAETFTKLMVGTNAEASTPTGLVMREISQHCMFLIKRYNEESPVFDLGADGLYKFKYGLAPGLPKKVQKEILELLQPEQFRGVSIKPQNLIRGANLYADKYLKK